MYIVRMCTYFYLLATISTQSRTEFTQVVSIFPLLSILKICRHQSRLTYAHISMEIESKVNETEYRFNVIE